jgi:hypothetical protein
VPSRCGKCGAVGHISSNKTCPQWAPRVIRAAAAPILQPVVEEVVSDDEGSQGGDDSSVSSGESERDEEIGDGEADDGEEEDEGGDGPAAGPDEVAVAGPQWIELSPEEIGLLNGPEPDVLLRDQYPVFTVDASKLGARNFNKQITRRPSQFVALFLTAGILGQLAKASSSYANNNVKVKYQKDSTEEAPVYSVEDLKKFFAVCGVLSIIEAPALESEDSRAPSEQAHSGEGELHATGYGGEV